MDEWNIPYSDIRIIELLGRDPVAEVYRGYWHGEVAIKRFYLPNATPEQISWFKEEVRAQAGRVGGVKSRVLARNLLPNGA